MAIFSVSEQLAGMAVQNRGDKLRDQVAELFLQTREDVYRYMLSLGLYPPEAQEAAQDVFLRLYAALKKGEEIQNPRAWLFRVAHNLGLKIKSRRGPPTALDVGDAAGLSNAQANPEQSLIEKERTMRFQNAIAGLSEQQRRCLFLRLEGLRYPEIGSVLGISASTVGEFLRRAIVQLKKGCL